METPMYQSNHRKIALGLSIIPGFGQLYNRQYVKGISFFILAASFLIVFKDLLNMGWWGLFTLGEVVGRDHSIFLLVEGILAVIISVFGLGFYAFNLRDAYKNGQKRDLGLKISSLREQYRALVDNHRDLHVRSRRQRQMCIRDRCLSLFSRLFSSSYWRLQTMTYIIHRQRNLLTGLGFKTSLT